MNLSEPLRRAIAEHGYTKPTPVQVRTFRPVRDGKDVIVRSKTGTGKTAAFAIPILERIPDGRRKPSALVMCPTRELAIQVAEEFASLAKHRDLSVVTIYGGASMGDQLDKLKAGAEIVVGTPGRIYDHIRRKTLRLDDVHGLRSSTRPTRCSTWGFFEEVTRILDHLPDDLPAAALLGHRPGRHRADHPRVPDRAGDHPALGRRVPVDNIHNVLYHTVDAYPKPRNLLYMIEKEEPETAIVFCNTRNDTALVTAVLNRNGYDAELLNGDLPQKERERVMAKVKRGEVRFMVATDIAARGIDISDLSHVINYSLPEDPAVFLHRVGRTGRIGKKGTSLSLVSGGEITTLSALQKKFGIALRGAAAADARGGQAPLDRAPRGRAEGGHEHLDLRGLHPAGPGAQDAAGRRVPDRLRAQVLLHPPPHREDEGRAEGRAQARGARAPREARARRRPPPAARPRGAGRGRRALRAPGRARRSR